ncbi:hypothetical protein LINPERHAP2_LOCUS15048 [Linum perenne]
MNWVLERRPWSMNMSVMNMVPYSPHSIEIFNKLQIMMVWIKLSRVPSHCITTRFMRGFLEYFGKVPDISLFGSRGRDVVFIKGLVVIDLLGQGRSNLVNSKLGQFSFITKEKRFDYSIQANDRGIYLKGKGVEAEQPFDAGVKPNNSRRDHVEPAT